MTSLHSPVPRAAALHTEKQHGPAVPIRPHMCVAYTWIILHMAALAVR